MSRWRCRGEDSAGLRGEVYRFLASFFAHSPVNTEALGPVTNEKNSHSFYGTPPKSYHDFAQTQNCDKYATTTAYRPPRSQQGRPTEQMILRMHAWVYTAGEQRTAHSEPPWW